jgi:hypothetical protein
MGNERRMGATFLLAALLVAVGIGTMFVAPWVGGGLLLVALIVGGAGLVLGGAAAATDADVPAPEREDVEAPHLPGPS